MQDTVFEKEGAFCIQRAITFETVSAIQKEMTLLMHDHASLSTYIIDLGATTDVNSAALGLLVELKKQAISNKKEMVFLNAPERLLSLAQVCGVATWLGLK